MSDMSERSKNVPNPPAHVPSELAAKQAGDPDPGPLLEAVSAYMAERGGGEGLFPTPLTGFNLLRSFETMVPMRSLYRPSLCIVLQGAKEIHVGERSLNYRALQFLVVSVELPAIGRISKASESEPYIGITLDFDVMTLRTVLEQLDEPPEAFAGPTVSAFVGDIDEPLLNCLCRLLRLSKNPKSIPLLYPPLMREICYWLLVGPHGGELRSLALPDTSMERIVRVISKLHSDITRSPTIDEMASMARMSPSSFHQHFKAVTGMTPLQFHKHLRLLEARRLMVSETASVAEAAYEVGYESPSQFSREYSRAFGSSPKQDALTQRRIHRIYANRTAPG